MSDKKKEIHVKDLVIKAENVIFEAPKRPTPRFDPFFGPRRVEGVNEENVDVDVDVKVDVEIDEESSSSDHEKRRRPFSWI